MPGRLRVPGRPALPRVLLSTNSSRRPYRVCDTVSTSWYAAPVPSRAAIRQTRQESRERIVAAATDLIRRTPYAALTVDDVMREAGIVRTLFYRHFDDLGDLLRRAGREAF